MGSSIADECEVVGLGDGEGDEEASRERLTIAAAVEGMNGLPGYRVPRKENYPPSMREGLCIFLHC